MGSVSAFFIWVGIFPVTFPAWSILKRMRRYKVTSLVPALFVLNEERVFVTVSLNGMNLGLSNPDSTTRGLKPAPAKWTWLSTSREDVFVSTGISTRGVMVLHLPDASISTFTLTVAE